MHGTLLYLFLGEDAKRRLTVVRYAISDHLKHLRSPHPLSGRMLPLSITLHYSQWPFGKVPIGAGVRLAYIGKIAVYSQWASEAFWSGSDIEKLM
jgi:hypothetical protein